MDIPSLRRMDFVIAMSLFVLAFTAMRFTPFFASKLLVLARWHPIYLCTTYMYDFPLTYTIPHFQIPLKWFPFQFFLICWLVFVTLTATYLFMDLNFVESFVLIYYFFSTTFHLKFAMSGLKYTLFLLIKQCMNFRGQHEGKIFKMLSSDLHQFRVFRDIAVQLAVLLVRAYQRGQTTLTAHRITHYIIDITRESPNSSEPPYIGNSITISESGRHPSKSVEIKPLAPVCNSGSYEDDRAYVNYFQIKDNVNSGFSLPNQSDPEEDNGYLSDSGDNFILHDYNDEIEVPVTDEDKIRVFSSEIIEDGDIIICMTEPAENGLSDSSDRTPVLGMYKRVDKRITPVSTAFPQSATVTRTMPRDPLDTLPELPTRPPLFVPSERLTQERLDSMDINDVGFLWPEEEKLFQQILLLNDRTLAFDLSEMGRLSDEYFSPYIMPTVPHHPWEYKNYPIPPGIKDQVLEIIKSRIENGIYEHCQSSYRSNWFCVLKKNGKLRIVHDLQPLNAVSVRDAGLPPILDEFVEPFSGRQCYTVFDMLSGYDARKIDPSSRELTAFWTPLGLLQLTGLPQGYTNSPAEFQRCMVFVLQEEIPHTANIFIDDLPIKGPETQYLDQEGRPETLPDNPGIRRFIWEHANDVHRIMHRIGCAGGTFAPKKAQLCRPEVTILGQKCTTEGRLPDDDKVKKILNWPIPRTPKEVRGFLGLCGTVRIWIKGYSELCRPLTELYRKGAELIWEERQQNAFDELKRLVSTAPALRPIDYTSDRPVVLSVDTSYIAAGFILSQEDEDGKRRPARYGSLPWNEREARYSQPKLELYGLYRALRHWRIHLVGIKTLHVEVDAQYIKEMLKQPDLQPNAAMNRWIQGILLFDFKLIHVPGHKFLGPDGLSRRPMAEGEEIIEDDDDYLDDIVLYTSHSAESPGPQTFITRSEQDQSLREILKFLITQKIPPLPTAQATQQFMKKAARFFVQENKMYKHQLSGNPLRVIFKDQERQLILKQAHDDLGHRRGRAVFQTLHQRFFWPHMMADIQHYVRTCHQCQLRSVRRFHIPITVSAPTTLFSKVYIDVMKMPAARGYNYIVAARDDLSGACEARALRNNNSESLANFFWEEIFCRYGVILQVVTDNGSETKAAFEKLMEDYGIPHVRISAYNSQANGVVEKGHFTLREGLVKACEGDLKQWPLKLANAVFADRITTSSVTGYSPYYLLYGEHPMLPFDITEATFMMEGYRAKISTAELLALRIRQLDKRPEDIARAAASLKKHRFASKEQFEKKYHKFIVTRHYEPGELVLMRNTRIEKNLDRKASPRYIGPFIVERRTTRGTYVLQELDGTFMASHIAAFRLAPYLARNQEALDKLANYNPQLTETLAEEMLEEHQQDKKAQEEDKSEEVQIAPRRSTRLKNKR
jgi:transposase InsO family protein